MNKTSKPSWDTYFMNIAIQVASRSPDPKKHVGAVIVDNTKRLLSSGYNGLPAMFSEENIDWDDRDYVSSVIIHAECNAILYCNSKFQDAKLYCTLSPCPECVKLIKACGISKVVYKEKYRRFDEANNLAKIFDIELVQLDE